MTWTYSGTPGTSTAAERRDAVRYKIGDTDTTDQQATDEEIAFALAQASDDIYTASAIAARAIAGKYSRYADTSIDAVKTSYSQLSKSYMALAGRLEAEAKKYGSVGLGVPLVGGISISEMDSVEEDSDRVRPAFRREQFRNPPNDEDDYGDRWR